MVLRLELHAARCLHHSLWHCEGLLGIAFQCGLGHFEEGFFDVASIEGASLIEKHVVILASPLLSLCRGHLAFLLLIKLVSKADEGERLRILRSSVLIKAISPATESFKRLLVSDVIGESAAIGTTIESIAQ